MKIFVFVFIQRWAHLTCERRAEWGWKTQVFFFNVMLNNIIPVRINQMTMGTIVRIAPELPRFADCTLTDK